MSMKLLKETITLTEADDGLKDFKISRKQKKTRDGERNCIQMAAVKASCEYDPELDDFIVHTNRQREEELQESGRLTTKNISLLERSRSKREKNFLRRNIKYMAYESERKVDMTKVSKLLKMMSEQDRRRKSILRRLHSRHDGVRDLKRKSRKSKSKSIFTEEDFAKVGPDRIKLLKKKAAKIKK